MTTDRENRLREIRERASGFNPIHLNRDTSDILWLLAEIERLEKAARIIQEQCAQGRCVTLEQAYEDAGELMP